MLIKICVYWIMGGIYNLNSGDALIKMSSASEFSLLSVTSIATQKQSLKQDNLLKE